MLTLGLPDRPSFGDIKQGLRQARVLPVGAVMQCGTYIIVILTGTCDKGACCTCIPACTALTGTSLGGNAMMLALGPPEMSLSREFGLGAGASLGPGAGRGGCGGSARAVVAQTSLSIR